MDQTVAYATLLAASLSFHQPSVAADVNHGYTPPRNEFSQPDIQGIWNFTSDVPLERPDEVIDKEYLTIDEATHRAAKREQGLEEVNKIGVGYHDKSWLEYSPHAENLRTSLITYPTSGKLPQLVNGVQGIQRSFLEDEVGSHPVRFFTSGIGKNGPEDRGLIERCIAGDIGPPIMPYYPEANYLQIIQTRDHIIMHFEQIHHVRIVHLRDPPENYNRVPRWFGTSMGRWDGDTLVVETENFYDMTASLAGAGSARYKKVTELFKRVSNDVIQYSATISDPGTFTDRIEMTFPMAKVDNKIYEYACHEGNYSMEIMLRGERERERP